jgi:hypothetical protein
MHRLILHQMRHQPGRAMALGAGILVAAVSFSLLTAATTTETAQVTGTVQSNLHPAYDILVRPSGSENALEKDEGLVRDNYLSGMFGGITMAQYQAIKRIPGVGVAAPIAMIGYVLMTVDFALDVTPVLTSGKAEVLTMTDDRVADRGLTRYPPEPLGYIYVTPDNLTPQFPTGTYDPFTAIVGDQESLPNGTTPRVCAEYVAVKPSSPLSDFQADDAACWSWADGDGTGWNGHPPQITANFEISFPFLVAAIDPQAEEQLDGLGGAVVSGRYLTESDTARLIESPNPGFEVPVLATTDPYIDDQDGITVSSLPPAAVDLVREQGLSPDQLAAALAAQPATPVMHTTISSTTAYRQLLEAVSEGPSDTGPGSQEVASADIIDAYWTAGAVDYTTLPGGALAPSPVINPDSIWKANSFTSLTSGNDADSEAVPIDDSDASFRPLTEVVSINPFTAPSSSGCGSASNPCPTPPLPIIDVVGKFDPSKLPGFSALSAVPMETYYPPSATGANAASRQALHNQSLLPDANIAGYLQEPPLMITTINALPAFEKEFPTAQSAAPISSVRIRVTGLRGTVKQELGEIAGVAAAIRKATGLQVDITAGSSPTTETVALPAGEYGRPALLLDESWVRKGVALVIVAALDTKSVTLFALILLVTALFLVNGGIAGVRARRREIGVLRCLGWPRPAIFQLILGELLLLGAVAGLLGTGISAAVILGLHIQIPLWRVGLITPVAVGLSGLAGLIPAWLATRGQPLDAVAPAVVAPRHRARPVRRLFGLAWSNLHRRPARAGLAAVALGVGVGALAVLLGIDLAFSQTVRGSLLGSFVTGEVRGVDYLSAALAITLGAASVADVLYVDVRERAPELAALAATGWRRRHLIRIALYEGAAIGLLGSLAGAIVGIGATWLLGGSPLPLLGVAVASVAAGVALAVAVSWIVIGAVSARRPVAEALAEE